MADQLKTECGISPEDIMISITENGNADWSFGGLVRLSFNRETVKASRLF